MTESAQNQNNKDRVAKRKPISIKPYQVHRKATCGKHSSVGNQESSLQNRSLLQRTCACGRHTVGGRPCPTCRQDHSKGQAKEAVGNQTVAEVTMRLDQSQYRQDSNLVKTRLTGGYLHSAGGEGGGDDDPEKLVGGESTLGLQTVSHRAGQLIQREDESSSTLLNFTTITAPHSLGCGGFRSQVRWGLDGANESTNGFVVQKVTFDLARERLDGGNSDFQTTYWEAWQVRSGKIYIGTSESAHGADTFNVPPAPNHRGSCYEAGWAKFIPDYDAPKSWGNVPEARALPSTTSEPVGWSDSGTIHRYMRNTFDCCEQSEMGDFDHGGSSNS